MNPELNRRRFVQMMAALSAGAGMRAKGQAKAAAPRPNPNATVNRKNVVGTQVKAYAWMDEGIDKLLDNLQEKGNINTVFAFTFLAGSGRIEKGGPFIL